MEMCQNANLRQQFELTVAMRELEKANADLQACSRKNDALHVRLFRSGAWHWEGLFGRVCCVDEHVGGNYVDW